METKHTPGKWEASGISVVQSESGMKIAISSPAFGAYASERQEANLNRIVACVNACESMADPAAEIAKLRADNERLRAALEACLLCNDVPTEELEAALKPS